MKVCVAIDSFKGSLTSLEAGEAIKESIFKVYPESLIEVCPLADGGEGTTEALAKGLGGELIYINAKDPLLRDIKAYYGIIKKENLAVMEMASASGITLVKEEERDILKSTTFGVGEMIKDAINKGIRNFIIGIGGSATNDCGTGMLRALGFEFLDKDNNEVEFGCKGLFDCVKIESKNALKELKDCSFNIACDVKNPLTGKNGCSYIYGPQKGGTKESIPLMDEAIGNFAELCKTYNKDADPEFPGAGAAGGLGFAFKYFLNAELKPGIDIIIDKTGIEDKIKTSDLVITGEGRLDNQTSMGKAPSGIAALSKKYNKPCIALSGCIGEGANICNDIGIDAYFPILQNVVTLDEALNKENAYKNTVSTTIQVMNLIKTFNNKF